MPSNHRTFTMEERMYLDMYNIVPTKFIDEWKDNHLTTHDPFGIKAPEEHEQIAISKAYEDRRKPISGVRGELGNRNALVDVAFASGDINHHSLSYEDLVRIDNRGTTRRNRDNLNYELKSYLMDYYPEETAFLSNLSNELHIDPIDTIVECIRVAMSTKALEPNVLDDINYELMNLEKEKGNGKHQKIQ